MRGHWHLAPHHCFLLISATVIMALTALFAASLLGTDLLRRTHAEQSPDGCSSNDFVLNVQKSLTFFSDTTAISYTVLAGNPNTSGVGCDVGGVALSLTTPDGVVHTIGAGLSFPIGTAVTVVGDAAYLPSTTAPASNGWFGYNGVSWVAVADASGVLLNNPVQDDPWEVRKTVSVLRASTSLSAVVAPPGAVPAGTPVVVTFVEANDGIVQLDNVTVTSPQCAVTPTLNAGVNQGDLNANGLLDPGESWIFSCTLVVQETMDVTGNGAGRLVNSTLVIDPSNDPDERATVRILVTPPENPPEDPPKEPPVDLPPVGDDPIPEDNPDGDTPTEVEPQSDPPGGLPQTGSGGIAGLSSVEPVAYGAIVMGLVTLGFAVVFRRVAGRGGVWRD